MAPTGSRRLFFALWPTEELRTRIARATRAEVRGTGGKPTPAENLHITLHFLGPTPENRIAPLIERVLALPLEPFEFTLDHYGYWNRSRTLWLGLRETPPAMARLARGLARISHEPGLTQHASLMRKSRHRGLARISREPGLPKNRRAFLPHMTLARKVNRLTPRDPPPPIEWPVSEFALVDSRLGGRHSRYAILERFG